jgi:predicted enzyme related to lactoylglutathione lyase
MMPQQQPGTPPIWLSYITVANCDASAAQAQKLGGKLCMPPKDIPTIGRIAVLTDPLGTPFGIHQPEGQG